MKSTFTIAITTIAIFLGCISPVMAGREIVPADVTVKVQYQLKMDGYNSWTTTNASLRGAVTESMMVSQLATRHPSGQIRILSASYGKTVSHIVRYQMKRGKSAWTNGTVTLNNVLTESMARNQLKAKFPGATIRILSFVKKK